MTKHPNTHPTKSQAHFDPTASAIIVERMAMRDPDVVREARRWTTGERGPLIEDPAKLACADLENYVTEAMRIGAHALSVTGQAHEAQALEHLLKDLGDRTADSVQQAAEATGRAAKDASEAVTKAATDAKKAITEVDTQTRKEFTTAVMAAKQDLNAEVRRIFGGKSPELLERLQPLLDEFGMKLDVKATAGTHELLTKAAKQFDPTDPTSPMAKHAAELRLRQEQLAEQLSKNHAELTNKVNELSTALKVQDARTALAKMTPVKGESYASQIHPLMSGIAGGLGDEYADTSTITGHLPRCKKGDGVLTVDSGAAHVVIEVTDSTRAAWGAYLDEAERNRDAIASLGLVRTSAQNGNQTIRVIGARRIVMAFDPETDDPELLRTTVMLLRAAAVTAAARKGGHEITTAEEKINEALAQLTTIDCVKKLASTIQKNATKIDSECTALNSGIRRLLNDALAALTGVESTTPTVAPVCGAYDGAA
ncbi:vacuolar-type H+-ATPase subunit E/Vma4 [Saccharothrix ecbatanensis]|uniref:Vacuolar-type H+-ATPase subunit E/Vma4 n=1 Tax=Saccharothrix ecbatanensis TaxID=1105145 RepID=A0A7W9M653_9PSEU|nr:Fis family transcriptional regulator [Saccharothrix ecbatanensis]MBB5808870.1 vacuolar-type H+-ATPase subunit E/Vma4 [Saccharothrix ecbatanensis]